MGYWENVQFRQIIVGGYGLLGTSTYVTISS